MTEAGAYGERMVRYLHPTEAPFMQSGFLQI